MGRFSEVLHGDLGTLFSIVSGDYPLEASEVNAALTNVIRNLIRIERRLDAESEPPDAQLRAEIDADIDARPLS